jgi:hypothetical protein
MKTVAAPMPRRLNTSILLRPTRSPECAKSEKIESLDCSSESQSHDGSSDPATKEPFGISSPGH